MDKLTINHNFYNDIKDILQTARNNTYKQINFIMVEAYYNIGKQIVLQEQNRNDRAKYGKAIIKELSTKLTQVLERAFIHKAYGI